MFWHDEIIWCQEKRNIRHSNMKNETSMKRSLSIEVILSILCFKMFTKKQSFANPINMQLWLLYLLKSIPFYFTILDSHSNSQSFHAETVYLYNFNKFQSTKSASATTIINVYQRQGQCKIVYLVELKAKVYFQDITPPPPMRQCSTQLLRRMTSQVSLTRQGWKPSQTKHSINNLNPLAVILPARYIDFTLYSLHVI